MGGRWRRTPLPVTDLAGLRPTPERVRETVFDWLRHLFGSFEGRTVLDLFAGSGALGLEGLSRGMRRADLVELSRAQAALLARSAAKLSDEAAAAQVHAADARSFLASTDQIYDVIFIDPPYALMLQDEMIEASLRCLAPGGVIYVERGGSFTLPGVLERTGLVSLRQLKAGQAAGELLARADGPLAHFVRAEKPLRGKAAKIAARQAGKAEKAEKAKKAEAVELRSTAECGARRESHLEKKA